MLEGELRYEEKYLLSATKWAFLKRRLNEVLRHDVHAMDDGTYKVISVYFDTDDDGFLHDKLAGIANRHFLRLRCYNSIDSVLLMEAKGKVNDWVYKHTLRISKDEYEQLRQSENINFLLNRGFIGEQIYASFTLHRPKPKIVISYVREALDLSALKVRVTIDSNIRASYGTSLADEGLIPLTDPQEVLLEVKGDYRLPNYVRDIIAEANPLRVIFSKYERAHEILSRGGK